MRRRGLCADSSGCLPHGSLHCGKRDACEVPRRFINLFDKDGCNMIKEHSKSVTIKDVAKAANVSITTVSRVLNNSLGLVNEQTRQRILDVIHELDYSPNAMARGLHAAQTKTIGLIIQDFTNPYYMGIVRSVEEIAQRLGYTIILTNAQRSHQKTADYLQILREKRVDGIIAIGGRILRDAKVSSLLDKEDMKIVAIGRPINSNIPSVHIDNALAARNACEYLISLGHRRIALIVGTAGPTTTERSSGYYDALKLNGIEVNHNWTVNGNFTFEGGYSAVENLAPIGGPSGITAIVAINDVMAIGAIKYLQKSGHDVPGDVSVIGFDDIQAASYVTPTLSTVAVPVQGLGRAAMETLSQMIYDKEAPLSTMFPTKIIARESTAPCKFPAL